MAHGPAAGGATPPRARADRPAGPTGHPRRRARSAPAARVHRQDLERDRRGDAPTASPRRQSTRRVIGEPAVWSNFQDVSKSQLAHGELLGFPLILLILLAGFGTVVAAVAPLALGFVAVFLSGAVIYALSRSFEISVYVTNMASMIGIGVAVDYSLFIVSRFRRELHQGKTTGCALTRAVELRHGGRLQRAGRRRLAGRALHDRRERPALHGARCNRRGLPLGAGLDHAAPRPALGRRTARRPAAAPAALANDEAGSDAFWSGWARRVMRRPLRAWPRAQG